MWHRVQNVVRLGAALAVCAAMPVLADEARTVAQLPGVTVLGERFAGASESATMGTVYAGEFQDLPLARVGELLEVVPGLILTQHSGEGKANQYFLRGFNLDHGTDISVNVDGVPVNLPSHAHGQGYADLNFLIPELVERIEFRKGPYYAAYGDFAAAGALDLRYFDRLPENLLQFSGGSFGDYRGLSAGSAGLFSGTLLYGLAAEHFDGPFAHRGSDKGTLVLRYTHAVGGGLAHLTATGYDTRFNSTDQIPARAVAQGLIGPFDCIDCTDGGRSYRYGLTGDLQRPLGSGIFAASAYAYRYHLNLYSDFTYFLEDPANGDQFEQYDSRNVYGGRAAYDFSTSWLGLRFDHEAGAQLRFDDIDPVALYDTRAQRRLSAVSVDQVQELGIAAYVQSTVHVLERLRLQPGLRVDRYHFNVESNFSQNVGARSASLWQPKLNLIAGPFAKTEFFVNLGKGFHTNDARGTTQTLVFDPRQPPGQQFTPTAAVTPIAAARGLDVGLRSTALPGVEFSASYFILHLDSELTFSGDTAGSEPNAASTREGIETALSWKPLAGLVVDASYAYSHARFRDPDPAGQHIPEAATSVAGLTAVYRDPKGYDAELKFRYFGPRPLTQDGAVSSRATKVVDLGAGYLLTRHVRVGLELLNVFDSRDHDIDYFYTSRLPGEPAAGVDDFHFHPVEPLSVRAELSYRY
ncbi:MAG: TonB-dependent receptor [Nevskia sp.]|nr:TonB-dependent receptor [Nevskia sp.]